ncbi:MAG TPA: hypothetical protein VHR66_31075 [Gemmataceae bacterium]|nr:hypothetical protein [Gemmataceae bacterium]
MAEAPITTEFQAVLSAVEPAARFVPGRALRRAIRLSRDQGTFRPRAIHDRCWWVNRDQLFQLLTPAELDLSPSEPAADLLLIPRPQPTSDEASLTALRRVLFHAAIDREFDLALRQRRLTPELIDRVRSEIGPTDWIAIRHVLEEQHLIDQSDDDTVVLREFIALGLELLRFVPSQWDVFFPGIARDGAWFAIANSSIDIDRINSRFGTEKSPIASKAAPRTPTMRATRTTLPAPAAINSWVHRGNDLKAAVLLTRAGDSAGIRYLDRLVHRLIELLGDEAAAEATWRQALLPLLEPASIGDWPVERRLLYEVQRACLAVSRTTFAVDLLEWMRSLGRRPIRRPLSKTKWLEAGRRFRAALAYADQLTSEPQDRHVLIALLSGALHLTESRAREELRPDIESVLDEVGLASPSVAERLARAKLVEELLDAAIARGFLRIGDLRDAIARNRVKLNDLQGPTEFLRGDPIIRANAKLTVRMDGVYRRGEVYMRLLQRGCSLFFGTPIGRALSLYLLLPFGGAFILLEAIGHLYEAADGIVNWLSGWTTTVNSMGLLGGGMARTLVDNPTLEPGGTSWKWVVGVGLFLELVLHWPTFRRGLGQVARFVFVQAPRAIRKSPLIHRLVHNRFTRFFRRFLLLPLAAGSTAALASNIAGADADSVVLVGAGSALLAGTFFRTALGREIEDRFDETMERVWRVVSVNFAVGVLTLILQFFHGIFEAMDRGIHAVDEWFRFREGESQTSFVFKLLVGAFWRAFAYLFRFAWNLLVEPQINPIKHFPVVTVSHKILLPLIGPLAKQFGIAKETMATIVFGIPGIFGFLVWELKENWKLYRSNAPRGIRPIQVGSHGESIRGLLRPGFHSGTVPKAFARLRKATRAASATRIAKCQHALAHVAEAVDRFVDRSLVADLCASRRWGALPIVMHESILSPNRIVVPITIGQDAKPITIAIDERNGWLIGSVPQFAALKEVNAEQWSGFADALLGFYMRAGVHMVREQMAAVFGAQAYGFDAASEGPIIPLGNGKQRQVDCDSSSAVELGNEEIPRNRLMLSENELAWSDWSARWGADAAGLPADAPLIAGWSILPPCATAEFAETPK